MADPFTVSSPPQSPSRLVEDRAERGESSRLLSRADQPLMAAVREGDDSTVAILLGESWGVEVDQPTTDGLTPLLIASHKGFDSVVALLIESRADVNRPSATSITPLLLACQQGHAGVAAKLLSAGARVNLEMDKGATPLFVACQKGHSDIVHLLIEAGAELDRYRDNGATPLYVASERGHVTIVASLLEAKASVNQANLSGASPLFIACQMGHSGVVEVLLGARAEVDQPKQRDVTPLFIASKNGYPAVVQQLLDAGAWPNHATTVGASPLYIACQEGQVGTAAVLLAGGADTDTAMSDGYTPMLVSCEQGQLACVQLLSSYVASRTATLSSYQYSAEEIAGHRRHASILAWLIMSRDWCTPLHHLSIIDSNRALALLRGGANIHAMSLASTTGPTPLSLARELCAAEVAAERSPADLVLRASQPWTPATHALFPREPRAYAVTVMLIGRQLTRLPRFFTVSDSLFGVWVGNIMPRLITREWPLEQALPGPLVHSVGTHPHASLAGSSISRQLRLPSPPPSQRSTPHRQLPRSSNPGKGEVPSETT